MTNEALEDFKHYWQSIESLNDFYTCLEHCGPDDMPDEIWLLFKDVKETLGALDAVLWAD